jgi:hypothetical protein
MVLHYYKYSDLLSIVGMGFLLFVLLFLLELVPNLSLIINAPKAIGNDLAGAPVEQVKFLAYSTSNSDARNYFCHDYPTIIL